MQGFIDARQIKSVTLGELRDKRGYNCKIRFNKEIKEAKEAKQQIQGKSRNQKTASKLWDHQTWGHALRSMVDQGPCLGFPVG